MKFTLRTLAATALMALAGTAYLATPAYAEETVSEQAKEAARDAKTGTKKAARKVEDKTCEMINGKLECAAKKAKHGVQNATDEAKDKVEDLKD